MSKIIIADDSLQRKPLPRRRRYFSMHTWLRVCDVSENELQDWKNKTTCFRSPITRLIIVVKMAAILECPATLQGVFLIAAPHAFLHNTSFNILESISLTYLVH